MKYININDIVKISDEEFELIESFCPAKFVSQQRVDQEKWLLLYWLAKQVKAYRCLDIGTAGWYSARAMAAAGAIVDTIDIVGEKPTNDGLLKEIVFHKGDSKEIVPNLPFEYDLCFIDGGHDYLTVKDDIRNCKKKCKIIVAHDFGNIDEVTRAIEEELHPEEIIICDRMWKGAPYENGIDKNGNKIDYGLIVWRNK